MTMKLDPLNLKQIKHLVKATQIQWWGQLYKTRWRLVSGNFFAGR